MFNTTVNRILVIQSPRGISDHREPQIDIVYKNGIFKLGNHRVAIASLKSGLDYYVPDGSSCSLYHETYPITEKNLKIYTIMDNLVSLSLSESNPRLRESFIDLANSFIDQLDTGSLPFSEVPISTIRKDISFANTPLRNKDEIKELIILKFKNKCIWSRYTRLRVNLFIQELFEDELLSGKSIEDLTDNLLCGLCLDNKDNLIDPDEMAECISYSQKLLTALENY